MRIIIILQTHQLFSWWPKGYCAETDIETTESDNNVEIVETGGFELRVPTKED